jgi:hypothetical protein
LPSPPVFLTTRIFCSASGVANEPRGICSWDLKAPSSHLSAIPFSEMASCSADWQVPDWHQPPACTSCSSSVVDPQIASGTSVRMGAAECACLAGIPMLGMCVVQPKHDGGWVGEQTGNMPTININHSSSPSGRPDQPASCGALSGDGCAVAFCLTSRKCPGISESKLSEQHDRLGIQAGSESTPISLCFQGFAVSLTVSSHPPRLNSVIGFLIPTPPRFPSARASTNIA